MESTYTECSSSAYMTHHRVHDNFILNQTGWGYDARLCGRRKLVYNNVIIQAGIGPRSLDWTSHAYAHTHPCRMGRYNYFNPFYNNTIYGGGYPMAPMVAMIGFAYPILSISTLEIISSYRPMPVSDIIIPGFSTTKGSMNVWWVAEISPLGISMHILMTLHFLFWQEWFASVAV